METDSHSSTVATPNVAALDCSPGKGWLHCGYGSNLDPRELQTLGLRPPPGMRIYKFGSRSVVGEYALQNGVTVCLKYYFPKQLYKHFTYAISGSRCRQSWEAALAFSDAGIPTPAPIAMIEWKRLAGLWLDRAFIVTTKAEGITLTTFAAQQSTNSARLKKVAAKLRESFSIMARHRIVHGDLKATNILVDALDNITFLDLDAARVVDSASRWQVLRDKDERIFRANWTNSPALAEAFSTVFS